MAKKLEIQRQGFPSGVAAAYNNLLGIKSDSQIVLLSLSQLDEIEDQPFPINDSKVDQIADSIENVGVIEPIIVVKNGERYNILSGRHRFRACQKIGKTEIPCYIKDTDETTARYILIATNTDRNNEYSPIVYARAYAEYLDLMKKMGKKAVVNAISEQSGMNRKQIYRYLRLNYLIPELQKWVEKSVLTIEAAVELSFLSDEKQLSFFTHLNNLGIADNVISRTFKVDKTKTIRQAAEKISDEEFSKNIDKIIFGHYGQESKPEPETAKDETAPAPIHETEIEEETEPETNIEAAEEENETEEPPAPVSALAPTQEQEIVEDIEPEPFTEPAEEETETEEPPAPVPAPAPKKEKMGLEAPKPDRSETAEEVKTAPTEKTVKSDSNSFEEIVKGYMLLALLEHGLDSESISLVQLDAVFDRYSKSEAAEIYRREC